MKVLLIDDDKDDQALFCEAVNQISNEIICLTADDGLLGLKLLDSIEEVPDIIFLDINMPRMDGKETLRSIKAREHLASATVIMFSTSSNELDKNWFRSMQVRYLVKPNDFPSLVRLLNREFSDVLITDHQLIYQIL